MLHRDCIYFRSEDGCTWCDLSSSALCCGHCRQYKQRMYDRTFRYKRVLTDDSFFFEERSGYASVDEVFLSAHIMAKVETDINHVDVYEGERLLATFYRVVY